MSSEIWNEKAARLLSALDTVDAALLDGFSNSPTHRREIEQATVARFLRDEFSGDPPDDTATATFFSHLT